MDEQRKGAVKGNPGSRCKPKEIPLMNTTTIHDSGDLSMKAIITDEASIAKVEAGLVERLAHVAHAVTRDSFRGFGINE